MTVVALCSANGGPGVTTTSVGLALHWPRPVLLVEADPRGLSGLLAGYLQGIRPYETGLVDLALSPLGMSDALREVTRQVDGTSVSFVAGLRSHTQVPVLQGVWGALAEALHELEATGTDVIVDAGALGAPGSPEALFTSADLVLLTVRSTLPALAAARPWADTIKTDPSAWPHPGLLVVGPGRPYDVKTAGRTLGIPPVAPVAWDPRAADVYYQGAGLPRGFDKSAYVRSLRAAVAAIRTAVAAARSGAAEEVRA